MVYGCHGCGHHGIGPTELSLKVISTFVTDYRALSEQQMIDDWTILDNRILVLFANTDNTTAEVTSSASYNTVTDTGRHAWTQFNSRQVQRWSYGSESDTSATVVDVIRLMIPTICQHIHTVTAVDSQHTQHHTTSLTVQCVKATQKSSLLNFPTWVDLT